MQDNNEHKARRGERLRIPAQTWNGLVDASKAEKRGRFNPDTVINAFDNQSLIRSNSTILVRNSSQYALASGFRILKIRGGAIPQVAKDMYGANGRIAFDGYTPSFTNDPFAIIQEPLEIGAIGKAVVAGLSVVKIKMLDVTHQWANPTPTQDGWLTSSTSGQARILWFGMSEDSGERSNNIYIAIVNLIGQVPVDPADNPTVVITSYCGWVSALRDSHCLLARLINRKGACDCAVGSGVDTSGLSVDDYSNGVYLRNSATGVFTDTTRTITICGVKYKLRFERDGDGSPRLFLISPGGTEYPTKANGCGGTSINFSVGHPSVCTGAEACGGPDDNMAIIQVAWMHCNYTGAYKWYCVGNCGDIGPSQVLQLDDRDATDTTIKLFSTGYETEDAAFASCGGTSCPGDATGAGNAQYEVSISLAGFGGLPAPYTYCFPLPAGSYSIKWFKEILFGGADSGLSGILVQKFVGSCLNLFLDATDLINSNANVSSSSPSCTNFVLDQSGGLCVILTPDILNATTVTKFGVRVDTTGC